MCGIFLYLKRVKDGCFNVNNYIGKQHDPFVLFDKIKHRGPDSSNYIRTAYTVDSIIYEIVLGFHRLKIIGTDDAGNQPFYSNGVYLLCNGEIYNYRLIKRACGLNTEFDCHVILDIYINFGIERVVAVVRGEFAFIIFDKTNGLIFISRDPIGVRPLFSNITAVDVDGCLIVSSEHKANTINSRQIDPGTVYRIGIADNCPFSKYVYFDVTRYYIEPGVVDFSTYMDGSLGTLDRGIKTNIRALLFNAVSSRLQSDVPVGFLLSGGLDSSLVLSIALHLLNSSRRKYKHIISDVGVRVFSVGYSDCAETERNDIYYAKLLITYFRQRYPRILIKHDIVYYTAEFGYNKVADVIRSIESYDQTTVRASIPMYILAEYIKNNTDVKVILSGDGSDELFGGYLYFHYAPDTVSFYNEIIKLLSNIRYFDVLRGDRCLASSGLELRLPFLEILLIIYVLHLSPNYLMPKKNEEDYIEKKLLRESFVDFLPDFILYRRKEAFSNGVGHSWITQLKASILANDKMGEDAYYLQLYIKCGYNLENIPYKWLPNKKWVNVQGNDSSATCLSCYK